jgi:hypothetical protein
MSKTFKINQKIITILSLLARGLHVGNKFTICKGGRGRIEASINILTLGKTHHKRRVKNSHFYGGSSSVLK